MPYSVAENAPLLAVYGRSAVALREQPTGFTEYD
jgi:hypothetical protein